MRLKKGEKRQLYTQMQMIFQDPYSSLNPRMSVQELIAEPMLINEMYAHDKQGLYQRVEELMDIVGLAKRLSHSYPHELDGRTQTANWRCPSTFSKSEVYCM